MTYKEPAYEAASFTCPHCDILTAQSWQPVVRQAGSDPQMGLRSVMCQSTDCGQVSVWAGEAVQDEGNVNLWHIPQGAHMVWPTQPIGPRVNTDAPEMVAKVYDEARTVLAYSPRAAGALIRLGLQMLMSEVGQKGKDLNTDIAALVKKGLRPEIAQALDAVRVIGNNAVHPGQINTDDKETVLVMFDLLNQIVDDLITRPRQSKEAWGRIPLAQRDAIAKRDK